MTQNDFTNVFEGARLGKPKLESMNLIQTIKNIQSLVKHRPNERVFLLRNSNSNVMNFHIAGTNAKLAQSLRSKQDEIKIKQEVKKLVISFDCEKERTEIN